MTAHARNSDPITSHLAAEANESRRPRQIDSVVMALHHFPGSTSAELAHKAGLDRHMVARRCADARAKGLIREGGARECSVNGGLAVTWWIPSKTVEQHRLECEARWWLRHCERDPARIKALLADLTEKRGKPQDRLRDEMRRQFKQ